MENQLVARGARYSGPARRAFGVRIFKSEWLVRYARRKRIADSSPRHAINARPVA
jgi:hypothetical protein